MNQPFLYRAAKMTEAGMIIGRGADDRPGEKAGPEKLPIRGEGRIGSIGADRKKITESKEYKN